MSITEEPARQTLAAMVSMTVPPIPPLRQDGHPRAISPTDVSRFIALDQCERYLRLSLYERAAGRHFLEEEYGVFGQAIPPLLTRSGADFERQIEASVRARCPVTNCADQARGHVARGPDNARIVQGARDLLPGTAHVYFQVRLHVDLVGWQLRGDADIVRMARDEAGALALLVADMKSSQHPAVEHRLQVAFYAEMLAALLAAEGVPCARIETAILYRGPAATEHLTPEEQEHVARHRAAATERLGVPDACLELVADPEAYAGAVRDLVTGEDALARRVAEADFAALPYCLGSKCDGCRYNEFCLKDTAQTDDLSLLPHLGASEKAALRRAGIATVRQLALLKVPMDLSPRPSPPGGERELVELPRPAEEGAGGDVRSSQPRLVPVPGCEALAQRLAATWPVGPRLDELVVRARRYRRSRGDDLDGLDAPSRLAVRGYGSLPYCDAGHNANLVRVYIDAQYDYLNGRVYLLGALVAACEGGQVRPERRRAIVRMSERPPGTADQEAALLLAWIRETVATIAELAAPDEEGRPRAPIHLIFYDRHDQRVLLDGLARHATTLLGATALYDFLTQLAAFDSPVVTFLSDEIRELKQYPLLCQSLQAVASYLRFDWGEDRRRFRTRLFDSQGRADQLTASSAEPTGVIDATGANAANATHGTQSAWPWYTRRARFSSNIPLEYAYAAWGELPAPPAEGQDDYRPYRAATLDALCAFQRRRLEAMEHITADFQGNRQTQKTAFVLPDLEQFQEKADSLAQALEEFVTIERHVALGQWKAARLPEPERRVLSGNTLLVRYVEDDQEPETRAKMREFVERRQRRQRLEAAYRQANPEAKRVQLTREEKAATACSLAGVRVRLRVEVEGVDCSLAEALALATLREGERAVVCPRWTTDERLPEAERTLFTPTPKQMLYGMRADIATIHVRRDAEDRPLAAMVEIEIARAGAFTDKQGFVFGGRERALVNGDLYTLDLDPNDWYGYQCMTVVEGLVAGLPNTLYERLCDPTSALVAWPDAAREGQRRFLTGLEALHAVGALHDFEPAKLEYIGEHGEAPLLLVQGPPGTGKSYTTGYAVFARLQGALAAGLPFRVFLACKTHAATDVLLASVARVRERLRALAVTQPGIFNSYFDPRLLDTVLFRIEPGGQMPEGVVALPPERARDPGMPHAFDRIVTHTHCVVAAPPGKVYRLLKDRWDKDLFGHEICACLILDEASQMNLPEAAMAALPLARGGQLVVVGDHRQMPPIVHHDWTSEPRRTFREYHSYDSLFEALRALQPPVPIIRFARSFRLHADMAEFLRREVYAQDGIPYYSERRDSLPALRASAGRPDVGNPDDDLFVASVLDPAYPLVVVVHDEAASMIRNPYEQTLITPILEALADPRGLGYGPERGLGVVVPHRAQRAALQEEVRCLSRIDPRTGTVSRSAVDTVERFQGDERDVIVISATESDRAYLLAAGEFLLDPRRLTVALSRAKRKLVLVAARSVFSLFSADDDLFANAQLWKNLLRRTCTVRLWSGERAGHTVEVWGNSPGAKVVQSSREHRWAASDDRM